MNWECYFSALSIPYCARKILRMQNFAPEKNDVLVSSTSPTVSEPRSDRPFVGGMRPKGVS